MMLMILLMQTMGVVVMMLGLIVMAAGRAGDDALFAACMVTGLGMFMLGVFCMGIALISRKEPR
jgi:hypothetical protein